MNIMRTPIGPEFIIKNFNLCWREILFGTEEHLIGIRTPVYYALALMEKSHNVHEKVIDLAGLTKDELYQVTDIVRELSAEEDIIPVEKLKRKWLLVLLSWLHNNKQNYKNLSQLCEEIYADFDYPVEMIPLIPWMPKDRQSFNIDYNNEISQLVKLLENTVKNEWK